MTAKRAPVRPRQKKDDFVRDNFVYPVGDLEIRLPSLSYLPPGLVRKVRRLSDIDAMYTLIETVLGEDSAEQAALDDMDADAYAAFLDAWREHSGVSLGKS